MRDLLHDSEQKLSIAAVPYLNALPLYVGLKELMPKASLHSLAPKAACRSFRDGKTHIGLLPVSGLLDPDMPELVALPDLGIACFGQVLSVYLASQVPLADIRQVYRDPESRTSQFLLETLAPKRLPSGIQFLDPVKDYEDHIAGQTAGLLIGDRALCRLEQYRHRLDLGLAWKEESGLPFVFALWAIRKDVASDRLVEILRLAFALGRSRFDQIADQWAFSNQFPPELARRYLREHIRYDLDDSCRESIALFSKASLRKISYHGLDPTDRSDFGRKAALAG